MAGWNQWPKNKQGEWHRGSKGKGKASNPVAPKDKSGKPGLPAYDSTSASSSLPSDVPKEGNKDGDFKAALMTIIAENNLQVPDRYKHIMEEDVNEKINVDQRLLNNKRKLNSKLERLKKASAKKDEQWLSFRNQLKEHLLKEQERYTQEKKEIKEAIVQTQLELDKMMNGTAGEEETPSAPDGMDVLEELTVEDATKTTAMKPDESTQMPEIIKKTQEDHQKLMHQMGELQQQMFYMVQAITGPNVGSPSRPVVPSSMMTPPKTHGTTRRTALAPFSRRNDDHSSGHSRSPRRTPSQLSPETSKSAVHVEDSDPENLGLFAELDGYGTT